MKKIAIGFSRARGNLIGSEIIMRVLNRPFSHTYFRFKEDMYEDDTVNHATGHGVNYMAWSRFSEVNLSVKEFPLMISDDLYIELLTDCHRNAGIKYGYWQNLGIAVVRVLKKFSIDIKKNPIDDGINCSEWAYYLLEEIYGKWTDTDPNLVAPDEIYDFLAAKEAL